MPRHQSRPTDPAPAGTSLARRYARVFSLLVGLLLAASGLISATLAYRDAMRGVEAVHREKAAASAERIRHFVDGIEQPLGWVLSDPARRGEATLEILHIELLQLLRRLPALTELRWIDAGNHERLALSRLGMDTVDSGRDLSVDPGVVGARRDGRHVGAVEFRRGTEPHLFLTLAAQPDGQVLIAGVNLKAVWDITRQVQHGETGMAYVVDARGQLLSHPDLSRVLRRTDMAGLPHVRAALAAEQTNMVYDGSNLDGTPVIAAAVPIRHLGWTVFVEQDRQEVLAPVWRALAQSAILIALGIVLAVAASTLLARRLVRPIRALQARAADIAAGRLQQRIEIRSGDELQTLAEQFNHMAGNLQALYESLEARVAERTLVLAEANEAKSRFLAAASHDLRQPVHALGLFVAQLRGARDTASRQALLVHIEHSVAAFESLLESLLDISRLDAGAVPVQREPVKLSALIERLASGFEPAAAAKGLSLRSRPCDIWVDSDPVLLERILLNLMGNAVRYTAQGRILVACRSRGLQVEICVADTGIGIAPELQSRVFQEFYRVPGPAAGNEPGLGLGLTIVRRLTELLDHGLQLRSVPGRGSAFKLRLPRVAEPQRLVAPPLMTEPLLGRRVLVLDDDAAVRESMRGQITQWGCAVQVAADGPQALALLQAEPPDLVITDLRLADGADGLALAAQLAAAGPPGLRVAVLTGETDPVRLQAVRDTGLPLLTKPLRPARLRALMEALLAPRP